MNEFNKIKHIPERAFYFPNFITEEEEKSILSNVYSSPKPKWTYLSNRRLQNWGGIPHPKGMIPEDIPQWLIEPIKKTESTGAFPEDKLPNHVLVNEYLPGQGIMRHLDGPLFYPTICTITCGSHAVLNFHPPQDKYTDCSTSETITTSVLLEKRSLIIIQEDLYHLYPHSIEDRNEDLITEKLSNLYLCAVLEAVNIGCNAALCLLWVLYRVKKLERLIGLDEDITDVSSFITAKDIISGQLHTDIFYAAK